jgi:integrase/recombinase XerD
VHGCVGLRVVVWPRCGCIMRGATLFKEIFELAGIRTSSHSGRRTFATRLTEKGVGMKTIQRLMGHKNIATTAMYCEVSDAVMRGAVELV